MTLDLAQRDRTGSTTYYYGRNGQRRRPTALDAILLAPDETYVASKDVAWYAQDQQYVDQESWQYVVWDWTAAVRRHVPGHPIRVLVLEVGEEIVPLGLRWHAACRAATSTPASTATS